ncbi:MAG TPA: hypothetical protein VNJ08_12615 [Bacteriovoracaceae bacterium]|nr:hypothetical protein [Bacteriovoracaceae bacterium]
MLNHSLNLIVLASLLLTTSCATIMSGKTDTIHVRSTVPGTKFYLNNTHFGTDDGSIEISKKRLKEAGIYARKDGCETAFTEIETRFDKVSLLGIFLDFGMVSILVIDWGVYGSVREAKKLNYVLSPKCPQESFSK